MKGAVIMKKIFMRRGMVFAGALALVMALPTIALAGGKENGGHNTMLLSVLWIAVLIMIAKLSGLVEKFSQPAVLGELTAGIVIGNLSLVGVQFFEPIKSDAIIAFLAELGVIFLLFQVGLESNIAQMKKVGTRSLLVALVGVVCPFVLGAYVVGPLLLKGLPPTAYLFLGAALTATSVGITARVFKDLGKLKTKEAQIVLGAAVLDDVIGLVILAVVSAIATIGAVSYGTVSLIFLKAAAFLVGSVVVGHVSAPFLGRMLSKVHTGTGMKFALAVSFCLIFAYAGGMIGLAPIVGAFAAGLILDPVHFNAFRKPKIADDIVSFSQKLPVSEREEIVKMADEHAHRHIEDLIEPLAHFMVPIFFVFTGMSVRLETLFNMRVLLVALGIVVVAIAGKYVSGLVAGKVNKNIVGFGMVPRGEVGLIFASIGSALGVISPEIFSVIVIMVIATTLITPPVLAHLLRRQAAA